MPPWVKSLTARGDLVGLVGPVGPVDSINAGTLWWAPMCLVCMISGPATYRDRPIGCLGEYLNSSTSMEHLPLFNLILCCEFDVVREISVV